MTVDKAANSVTYVHILFDRHEIVFAEGAPSESLFTGPEALKSLSSAAQAEVFSLFPELRIPGHLPTSARRIPIKGRKVRNMVHRHIKNDCPLVGRL